MDFDSHKRSGIPLGGDHYAHRDYRTTEGGILSIPANQEPGEGWVFVGITESHKKPDGSWCGGWVGFTNVDDPRQADGAIEAYRQAGCKHELVSEDPLTIEPSLACRTCPSHGWVRNGRWEDA